MTDLHPASAAARAGIQRLGYITRVNSEPVNTLLELRRELEEFEPGDVIYLSVSGWSRSATAACGIV